MIKLTTGVFNLEQVSRPVKYLKHFTCVATSTSDGPEIILLENNNNKVELDSISNLKASTHISLTFVNNCREQYKFVLIQSNDKRLDGGRHHKLTPFCTNSNEYSTKFYRNGLIVGTSTKNGDLGVIDNGELILDRPKYPTSNLSISIMIKGEKSIASIIKLRGQVQIEVEGSKIYQNGKSTQMNISGVEYTDSLNDFDPQTDDPVNDFLDKRIVPTDREINAKSRNRHTIGCACKPCSIHREKFKSEHNVAHLGNIVVLTPDNGDTLTPQTLQGVFKNGTHWKITHHEESDSIVLQIQGAIWTIDISNPNNNFTTSQVRSGDRDILRLIIVEYKVTPELTSIEVYRRNNE